MKSVSISKKFLPLCLLFALPKLEATISADFLYWFPSEEVASIWADEIDLTGTNKSWDAVVFDMNWDYGLRLGADSQLEHDQWDTAVYWTWFQSSAKHTLSPQTGTSLSPEFFAAFLSGDGPRKATANWRLLLNLFDWELGRQCCLHNGLSLRPFIGLKGGWIRQTIDVEYFDLVIDGIFPSKDSAKERLTNHFWGAGPVGGINNKWAIFCNAQSSFELFGDFSIATMWGTWSCDDRYANTTPATSTVSTKKSPLGALMFRGFVGAGWTMDTSQVYITAKLGYEMQFWANQLRIATFQLQRLHHDLTLQGITLHFQLDF